jgi:aryl-alcohol dehydrogenase-like predicted oxidoreductase
MRKAADVLARYGIPLAANQVQYSLLHRAPETNGVLDACRQMDVALIAYRPMAGGAVSAGPASARAARLPLRTPCKKWQPPGKRPLFRLHSPGCSSEIAT